MVESHPLRGEEPPRQELAENSAAEARHERLYGQFQQRLYVPQQLPDDYPDERTVAVIDDHVLWVDDQEVVLNPRQTALFNVLAFSPVRAIHTTHAALLGLTNAEPKTRMRTAAELRDKLQRSGSHYVYTESAITHLDLNVRITDARSETTQAVAFRRAYEVESLTNAFLETYRDFPQLHDPLALQEKTANVALYKFSHIPYAMQVLEQYTAYVAGEHREIRLFSVTERQKLALDVFAMAQTYAAAGAWHQSVEELSEEHQQIIGNGVAAFIALLPSCTALAHDLLAAKHLDTTVAKAIAARTIKRFNPNNAKHTSLHAAVGYMISNYARPTSSKERQLPELDPVVKHQLQERIALLSSQEIVIVALRNKILLNNLPREGVLFSKDGTRTSYAALVAYSLQGRLTFRKIGALLGISDGFVRKTYKSALSKVEDAD